ncbi:MAG: VWA domain-containing protein [Bifidobacteriaceae bacterium]|jgi:Ca-activated chloride channel family protein|nr:VWA domain-containing protein [Bifidobacteriaceae bacterium]
MSFAAPWMALIGLVVPLLLGIVWVAARRRRRAVVHVSSVGLVRSAVGGTAWRRRIPAVLLVLALVVATVAAARPRAWLAVPSNSTRILLAVDLSSSMCITDVPPNRLVAAQEAATQFIDDQPSGTTIGLVTFAGSAGVLVPPTTDKSVLRDAVAAFTTSRGTAIGQAILVALDAIAEVDPSVPPTGVAVQAADDVPLVADAIVLLTDGSNSQGVDPLTAAEQAAARGVPVFTIGFGTEEAAPSVCDVSQLEAGSGGYGGSGGGGRPGGAGGQTIDEAVLQEVADMTQGQYFRAEDADQLQAVLADLPSSFATVHKWADLAAWFAAAAGLLAAAGVGLALWQDRPRRIRGAP